MSRTHLAFGLLVGLFSLRYLNVPHAGIFLGLVCLSTLIADIDNSNSKVGKRVKTISATIEKTIGHRTFFHSLFPLMIITALFFFILKWNVAGMAILLGYGSHIFIDAFTHMGIGPLYPLHKKRVKGFIKTGSLSEHIFFFTIIVLNIIVLGEML